SALQPGGQRGGGRAEIQRRQRRGGRAGRRGRRRTIAELSAHAEAPATDAAVIVDGAGARLAEAEVAHSAAEGNWSQRGRLRGIADGQGRSVAELAERVVAPATNVGVLELRAGLVPTGPDSPNRAADLDGGLGVRGLVGADVAAVAESQLS